MKKNILLILLFLTSMFTSFGQATSSGSTLTVTDLSGSVIYYEFTINLSGAKISSTGVGAPLSTPIKVKITSSGTSIKPYFVTGDLNGACDSFLVGSMNSTNTEFTTTLNYCCEPIAEGYANGVRFNIPIKCATPIQGECITYNLTTDCNYYCVSFYLDSTDTICINKNYTVQLGFRDGTSTNITVNFSQKNTVFCFSKPINTVLFSTLSVCKSCGTDLLHKNVEISKKTLSDENNEIDVFPNPAKSIINFTGNNLQKYSLSIFEINGNLIIKEAKMNSEINIEKLPSGVYLYVIEGNGGFKQEGKIIKE